MEPRVHLSADLVPATSAFANLAVESLTDIAPPAPSDGAAMLVVLDTGIVNADALESLIRQDHPEADILRLDGSRDAFDQIGDRLAQGDPVGAIHLIANGQAGQFVIRGAVIDASELARRQAQLQTWNLAAGADILLYGCDIAAGPNGEAFVRMLASLTGADVAASTNLTGHEALGGDWTLEFVSGDVLTGTIAGPQLKRLWRGTLEATVTPASDDSSGVLAVSPPLAFERNVGQTDGSVDYVARGGGYDVFLLGGDAVIDMRNGDGSGNVVSLGLAGAAAVAPAVGERALVSKSHYLVGEQANWHTDVANFGAVRYADVYDGIDVRYYGTDRQLEYDFLVAAGANPDDIALAIDGATSVALSATGDLVLTLDDAGRTMVFEAPVTYQLAADGTREHVDSAYVIRDDGTVGFSLGAYDRTRALVIDPVLSYATYLGGTGLESGEGSTVDSSGNLYVTGRSGSSAFPTSVGAYDTALGGSSDVYVTKFDAAGTLQYSTFYGGSGNEWAYNIAVDGSGYAYVVGETSSTDLAIVGGADSSWNGGTTDGFLLKLNAAGTSVLYSTYYGGGGADYLAGVDVGTTGIAYVDGGTYGSSWDGMAAAYNTAATGAGSLSWSQSYAAFGTEKLYDLDRDSSGNIYLIGEASTGGLSYGSPYDSSHNGGADVFLVKMSSAGALLYVSYYGGTGNDIGNSVQVAADGTLYVGGYSYSTSGIDSAGAYDTTGDATNGNGFLAHFDTDLSGSAQLLFGTYFGTSGASAVSELSLDSYGRPVVVGTTSGTIPTTVDAHDATLSGSSDGFVAVFAADGSALAYASYLGGSGTDAATTVAIDSHDNIYVAGATASTDFATAGAYDTTGDATNNDAFVAKLASLGSRATATTGGGLTLNTGSSANDAYLRTTAGGSIVGNASALTLEFDVAIDANAVADNMLLSYASAGQANELLVSLRPTGALQISIKNVSQATANTYSQLLDGNAHRISITWDKATGALVFYIDGAAVETFSGFETGAVIDTGGTLVLGMDQDSVDGGYVYDQVLAGTLYDVRIFNTVRSAAQIAASHDADLPRFESGLVANWKFDDLSDDNVVTEAVSGYDLTVAHAAGSNFATSTPALTFRLAENAATGSAVGTVSAVSGIRDQKIDALLAADANLHYNAETNKFYKFDSTTRIWSSAQTAAIATTLNGIAGQLVTVHSASENAYVKAVAGGNGVWLGGGDAVVEGVWRWYSGSTAGAQFWQGAVSGYRVDAAYTNFGAIEPNDNGGAEDRLEMQASGTWNDNTSTNTNGSIVEWDADAVLDATSAVTYSITSQTVTGAFAIDADTGAITVADGSLLDDETAATHTLNVRVTEGTQTYDKAYTVTLVNQSEEIANTVPGAQATNEDTAKTFSSAGGNAITVSDGTATNARLQVSLSVSNGTLTLSQTTGLTLVSGSNGSAAMVIDGTESAIDAALDGMSYLPTADYAGSDTIQVATSLAADLQAWYTFDAGTAADSAAGTAQDGTLLGDATTSTDAARGTVLSLDGSGDGVQIASTFGASTDITIGGWVNLLNASTRSEFISLGDRVGIALDDTGNGVKAYIQNGASTWNDISTGRYLEGTGWHHLMYVVDDTNDTHTLYIDGVVAGTESTADSIDWTGATTAFLGRDPSGSYCTQGYLDDVRVFNRALNADEVAALAADHALTDTDSVAISIAAVNDAPTIASLSGDSLAYAEGDGNVVIEQGSNAAVTDIDSTDFGTGTLTVLFAAGSDSAEDVLAIRDQGSGAGQIGLSGANVQYGGVTIGTYTGGSSGSGLVITLNASSNATNVSALLKNITFQDTDTAAPTTGARTVRFVLTDGDGGTSANYDTTVTVSAVDDAPTIASLSGDSLNYAEGDGVVVIEQGADAAAADADSSDFDTGTLTISFTSGSDSAEDVLGVRHQGSAVGQIGLSGANVTYGGTTFGTYAGGAGGTPLVVTFNSNATPTGVSALLRNVTFQDTDTATPTTGARTVRFVLTDGDGGTSSNYDTTVTVSGTLDVNVGAISGTTTEAGGTATFAVVLDMQPSADVTIAVSSSDTTEGTASTALLTFTSGNWNIAQTVTVTGVDDALDDGAIAYSILTGATASTDPLFDAVAVADVSVTNTDNDTSGVTVSTISGDTTEAGGSATFTVVLDAQPTADVTISVATGDATEGSVATSSLTFTSGNWNIAQTVTVTGVDDALDDGDVAYSITTGAASSADSNYNGIAVSDVSVTNSDNDASGVTVSAISGNTTELGGSATFTVVLDAQPTADVTISVATGDATEGSVSTSSLTFTSGNWNIAQTVTVTGVDDAVADGDVVYSITTGTASSADGDYNGLAVSDVALTNTDNDSPGVTVSAISGTTSEAGGTATFTVVLNTQPTADVTISIATGDATEGSVATSSLTFTSGNWNIARTVTVTGVDDSLDDGDVPFTITTGAAVSADANYGGLAVADVTVVNVDDDSAPLDVLPAGQTVAEDTALDIPGLSVTDAELNLASVALGVGQGTLSVSLAGGAGIGAGANGTSSLTLTGTDAQINAALATLRYQAGADFNGSDVLTILSADATGLADADTLAITVTSVNDLPSGADGTITINEDATLTFGGGDFGFADIDAGDTMSAVRIDVVGSAGTLALSGIAVTAGQVIGVAQIGSLTYVPATDGNGVGFDAIAFSVRDGAGAFSSASNTLTLDVTAVDDAPVLSSAALSVAQGETVTLGPAHFAVTDVDGAVGPQVIDVRYVTNGRFEDAAAPGVALSSFPVTALGAGSIRFVHSGSSAAPAFEASVRDTATPGTYVPAAVAFTPTPVVVVPGPTTLEQMYSVVLTPPTSPPAPTTTSDQTASSTPEAPASSPPTEAARDAGSTRSDGQAAARTPGAIDPRVLMMMATPRTPVVPAALTSDATSAALAVVINAQPAGPATTGPGAPMLLPVNSPPSPTPAQAMAAAAVADMAGDPDDARGPAVTFDFSGVRLDPPGQKDEQEDQIDVVVNGVRLAGMSLSVGVVTWALRAGGLVSSLLASLPAWRYVDPLPILERAERQRVVWRTGADDEEVDTIGELLGNDS
ncbi:MAG: DUF4347 domain-containing protein [Burkholderiales bacterium]